MTLSQHLKYLPLRVARRGLRTATALPANGSAILSDGVLVPEEKQRLGNVALVGTPNAGKSTLLNKLVDTRLAAVSRKENTTRRIVRGVYTRGDTQLLVWDTPGVLEQTGKRKLGAAHRDLASTGRRASLDADSTVVVVDAARSQSHFAEVCSIVRRLASYERPDTHHLWLCLSKVDRVRPRHRLLDVVDFFAEQVQDSCGPPFVTSASTGRGVENLRDQLLAVAPYSPFEVRPGIATEDEDADVIEQHVWEKLLHRLHQEVPYKCVLQVEEFSESPSGKLYAAFVVRVLKKAHVPILVGNGGEVVRWVVQEASRSAAAALGRPVSLKIRVARHSASTQYSGGYAMNLLQR